MHVNKISWTQSSLEMYQAPPIHLELMGNQHHFFQIDTIPKQTGRNLKKIIICEQESKRNGKLRPSHKVRYHNQDIQQIYPCTSIKKLRLVQHVSNGFLKELLRCQPFFVGQQNDGYL